MSEPSKLPAHEEETLLVTTTSHRLSPPLSNHRTIRTADVPAHSSSASSYHEAPLHEATFARPISLDEAKQRYRDSEHVNIVCNYLLTSLKPKRKKDQLDNEVQTKCHVGVLCNHNPDVEECEVINAYLEGVEYPHDTFLEEQSQELLRLNQDPQSSHSSSRDRGPQRTRWISVLPSDFCLLASQRQDEGWKSVKDFYKGKNDAVPSAVNAPAGPGETEYHLNLESSVYDRMNAFCSRENYTVVDASFMKIIDAEGIKRSTPYIRRLDNTVRSHANSDFPELIAGYEGFSQERFLKDTAARIRRWDQIRSAGQRWASVSHQDFDEMLESERCNTRRYAGYRTNMDRTDMSFEGAEDFTPDSEIFLAGEESASEDS